MGTIRREHDRARPEQAVGAAQHAVVEVDRQELEQAGARVARECRHARVGEAGDVDVLAVGAHRDRLRAVEAVDRPGAGIVAVVDHGDRRDLAGHRVAAEDREAVVVAPRDVDVEPVRAHRRARGAEQRRAHPGQALGLDEGQEAVVVADGPDALGVEEGRVRALPREVDDERLVVLVAFVTDHLHGHGGRRRVGEEGGDARSRLIVVVAGRRGLVGRGPVDRDRLRDRPRRRQVEDQRGEAGVALDDLGVGDRDRRRVVVVEDGAERLAVEDDRVDAGVAQVDEEGVVRLQEDVALDGHGQRGAEVARRDGADRGVGNLDVVDAGLGSARERAPVEGDVLGRHLRQGHREGEDGVTRRTAFVDREIGDRDRRQAPLRLVDVEELDRSALAHGRVARGDAVDVEPERLAFARHAGQARVDRVDRNPQHELPRNERIGADLVGGDLLAAGEPGRDQAGLERLAVERRRAVDQVVGLRQRGARLARRQEGGDAEQQDRVACAALHGGHLSNCWFRGRSRSHGIQIPE